MPVFSNTSTIANGRKLTKLTSFLSTERKECEARLKPNEKIERIDKAEVWIKIDGIVFEKSGTVFESGLELETVETPLKESNKFSVVFAKYEGKKFDFEIVALVSQNPELVKECEEKLKTVYSNVWVEERNCKIINENTIRFEKKSYSLDYFDIDDLDPTSPDIFSKIHKLDN